MLLFIDVNECLVATDNNCSHICVNTNGNFQCLCNNGYILSSDNTTCFGKNDNVFVQLNITHIVFLDVNECLVATDNNCSQICVNTIGSFHCQCNSGYILSSDNSTCNGWLI